jgi:hypothetical protein
MTFARRWVWDDCRHKALSDSLCYPSALALTTERPVSHKNSWPTFASIKSPLPLFLPLCFALFPSAPTPSLAFTHAGTILGTPVSPAVDLDDLASNTKALQEAVDAPPLNSLCVEVLRYTVRRPEDDTSEAPVMGEDIPKDGG